MQDSRLAIVRLWRVLKVKLESGLTEVSDHDLREWASFALAGVLAVFGALYSAISVIALLSDRGAPFVWEEAALLMFEAGPVGFSTAVWLQTLGTDFTLIIVVLTSAGIAIWNRRPLLAVSIVMSLILMDAAVRIGWFSLERQRPDIIAQGIATPGFHSFPSGHTAKTLAIYGLLASHWFRASHSVVERILIVLLVLLIALIVPFGRMRMGAHWPTDIMGGYLLATVWLIFIVLALRHEPLRAPPP